MKKKRLTETQLLAMAQKLFFPPLYEEYESLQLWKRVVAAGSKLPKRQRVTLFRLCLELKVLGLRRVMEKVDKGCSHSPPHRESVERLRAGLVRDIFIA
jgi:hypothetical protein